MKSRNSHKQFRIEEIDLESPHLEAVIKLHTVGKARLGLFPRGAFEEYARLRKIVGAITAENQLAGYVLYRIAKDRAAIVHLTTDSAFRKQGVASLLVDSLKGSTRNLLGISLLCRRDYNINHVWQSLGFTVRHSKQGRGASGALLDYWWFDQKHDDLFSKAASRDEMSGPVLAVLDANAFYDLTCDQRPHAEDTKAVQADWLQESIELCVTPEIYNEIHRSPNEEEKKRCRMAAQTFRELKPDDSKVRKVESQLGPLFNGATFDRDISDMRQVAYAIAADASLFITRDAPMLGRSDSIFQEHGLRILHPTDVINRFDILRREAEYRPARLEGSKWHERLVVSNDMASIVPLFKHASHERSGNFERHIRHYMADPNSWKSSVVGEGNKSPTIFLVRSTGQPRVEIALFRHTEHPLAGTLLRHIMHETSRDIGDSKQKIIVVTDPELSTEATTALAELGFVEDSGAWWKLSLRGLISRDELVLQIRSADIPTSLKERLVGAVFIIPEQDNPLAEARLEHLFSPGKLMPSLTPCYIVSIRQTWAQHFFDIPVGAQTIMDLNEKLHLGIEGAYYCSSHNVHLKAPSRVLWYVSGKGSMCIKACSHLEEIFVGLPKEVYARFRHLGVYAWKHVVDTAGKNLDNPIMAFRFSRTERFAQPISLDELQQMEVPQPQNPRRITGEQFAAIYRRGMKL